MKKKLLFLCVLLAIQAGSLQAQAKTKAAKSNKMKENTSLETSIGGPIAHVVYFWLKNPDAAEDRAAFEKSLTTFIKNSKFAKTYHIGIPAATPPRPVVDASYTYNLIVTFDTLEDQEGYQAEPAHLQFIEECKDLWDRVVVYDSDKL
ncbi:MAG TPA: Dabb family protein [Saprospiraceae bacterium]|nr:Dabb family protein [Saprospiraceae bacterium]HMQ82349.1 Dabb family protein [Saprospiraceae bacterium]